MVGIIGSNGAGKSTLLKLLSRITSPTIGSIKCAGTMASLLEVGTGFHPELTGIENIFLNGAILGMKKSEIKNKLDEIIEFSGCSLYIDTPVKRYSSGMKVRLGFAVAAFLEPEILIVDEVLAVGDYEFQKKAIGKMKDVSEGQGRTVLFVSHNMASLKSLCHRGIVLQNGSIVMDSDIHDAVSFYSKNQIIDSLNKGLNIIENPNKELKAHINSCSIIGETGEPQEIFDVLEKKTIRISFTINEALIGVTPIVQIIKEGEIILNSFLSDEMPNILNLLNPGTYCYEIELPFGLKKGKYSIDLRIGKLKVNDIDYIKSALVFDVEELNFDPTVKSFSNSRPGIIPFVLKWKEKKNN